MKDTTFLLKQYNDLKVEISELENRIEKLEIKIEQDSVKGSSNVFPYTERKFTIEGYNYPEADKKEERLIKLNNLLSKRKNKCEDMKLQIEEFINNIPDSRTRRVFQYRYIDNLSWQAIAIKIRKTDESYPRKIIHDKYLENL
ncbi:TPA: hypothetical protein PTV51_002066 [Clostridium botulinum]|nr:hypothetical protein [Clostridium botulinum]HDK7201340.1 hypothetical protein [Clostridium botulinum]